MEELQIKKGDVVIVKSGGPKMVAHECVQLPEYLTRDRETMIKCFWHNGQGLQSDEFPLFLLSKVDEKIT